MKFPTVAILVFAAVAVVVANTVPTAPKLCDFKCTQLDLPVCGTNGLCFLKFTGKCELEKYNCLNPQKAFEQVEDFKCGEVSLPQCKRGDF